MNEWTQHPICVNTPQVYEVYVFVCVSYVFVYVCVCEGCICLSGVCIWCLCMCVRCVCLCVSVYVYGVWCVYVCTVLYKPVYLQVSQRLTFVLKWLTLSLCQRWWMQVWRGGWWTHETRPCCRDCACPLSPLVTRLQGQRQKKSFLNPWNYVRILLTGEISNTWFIPLY